ncbi:glycosyltransferase family 39 protein [Aliiroseovarius sediminis]|uniref:ArnT family glycosyltransferase n=1 Tax=Aliiroseovarius sediminis TaxID=2925839 RepID=UPI001F5A64B8|nr:glycosyltransferase family 39 protein [uncultured Aliiroseovarius sp.]MCI2393884.1 DUF2079 domain-containing protein [Aliiroseovarius sediminis]
MRHIDKLKNVKMALETKVHAAEAVFDRVQTKQPPTLTHTSVTILTLLALTLISRIGSLQTEVFNWDESTFILVGSSFAHGHLPYTETWDIKPPGLTYALGAALAIFGDTMVTVRMFGAACVFAMAVLVFLICKRHGSYATALSAAVMTICAQSVSEAQGVYTETLAITLVLAGLYTLMRAGDRVWMFALAGLLIGAATVTRTNMAFVALTLGIYLIVVAVRTRTKTDATALALFTVGGFTMLGLVIAPYVLSGQLDLFIFANVTAPLEYASGQLSPFLIFLAIVLVTPVVGIFYPDIWGIFLFLAVWAFVRTRPWQRLKQPRQTFAHITADREAFLIALTGASVVLGMSMNGAATWHHLIQLVPFLAIAAAQAIEHDDRPRFKLLVLVMVVTTMLRTLPGTVHVLSTGYEGIKQDQTIATLAREIAQDQAADDRVFALGGQLVYWYLKQPPLNKYATHPSNIFKPLFVDLLRDNGKFDGDIFEETMKKQPKYILWQPEQNKALDGPAGQPVRDVLASKYALWTSHGAYVVYRRTDN